MAILRPLLAAALLSVSSAAAFAQAAVGPLYEISEPDILDEIQTKAKSLESDPEFQRRLGEDRQRAVNRARQPAPVQGVGPAIRSRTSFFDPTIVVEEDIQAPDGQFIAKRGDRVNPLDQVPWRHTWYFIDGGDERQVALVRRAIQSGRELIRPVLVSGSPIQLMKTLNHRVYFDQQGLLIEQFGIRSVPATVRQDGRRLRIDEFPIESPQ